VNPFIWQNLAEISARAVADRIESELFSAFETLTGYQVSAICVQI